MTAQTQLKGLKETREAMQDLGKTLARNVGRRALRAAGKIIVDATAARAPVSTDPHNPTPGSLKASPRIVNAKASKRWGAVGVAVLVEDPAAVRVEFGRTNQQAEPFFRPAIAATETAVTAEFERAVTEEVEAAAARVGKRSKAAGS